MDPEPLIRIATRILLDNLCKSSRVESNFLLEVTCADQWNLGLEPKTMLLSALFPNQKPWNNRGVSAKSEYRKPGGGTSRRPKKVTKHSLIRQRVYVNQ
jgi:hypothetical protein